MSYIVEVMIEGCERMYLGSVSGPLPAAGAGQFGSVDGYVTTEERASLTEARQYVVSQDDAAEFETMEDATKAVGVHAGDGVAFAIETAF